MITFLLSAILVTSTFEGMPYTISSTFCPKVATGCYQISTRKVYIVPAFKNHKKTLWHEQAHYNWQYLFDKKNKKYKETVSFWSKHVYKPGLPPWENMAYYYADYRSGNLKISLNKQRNLKIKEIITWFLSN